MTHGRVEHKNVANRGLENQDRYTEKGLEGRDGGIATPMLLLATRRASKAIRTEWVGAEPPLATPQTVVSTSSLYNYPTEQPAPRRSGGQRTQQMRQQLVVGIERRELRELRDDIRRRVEQKSGIGLHEHRRVVV